MTAENVHVIEIRTPTEGFVDLTPQVRSYVSGVGKHDGVCTVFVPHTTAGVTINENADPDVQHDLLLAFSRMVPDQPEFRHAEGNSSAHTKASIVGSSVNVIVADGDLMLGTWQGIYLAEFDGPRERKVWVTVR